MLDLARPFAERRPGGLGWLGDAYLASGHKADAAGCFRQAVAVGAPSPDDWLRLALRQAEAGDPGAAEATLAAAREKLPPQSFLATAVAFADGPAAPKGWAPELTTPADRRAFAQARLALKLSRYQRTEAADMLEAFLRDGSTVPPADAAWARRNLAMLLVIQGTTPARDRAMGAAQGRRRGGRRGARRHAVHGRRPGRPVPLPRRPGADRGARPGSEGLVRPPGKDAQPAGRLPLVPDVPGGRRPEERHGRPQRVAEVRPE